MASDTQSVAHKEWVVKIARNAERYVIKVWVEHSETDRRMDLPNPIEIYQDFVYQFFTQNIDGIVTDWLWYRFTRTERHFINLRTGSHHWAPPLYHCAFTWDKINLNPAGTIAAIEGNEWNEPFEIRFFDFRDLTLGCPKIEFDVNPDYELGLDDAATFYWSGKQFHFARELAWSSLHDKLYDDLTAEEIDALHNTENPFTTKLAYKLTLEYDGTKMIYKEIIPEPFYAELIA